MGERIRELLARDEAGGVVTARGWLRTARHAKGVSFLEVSDGSCFAGLQARDFVFYSQFLTFKFGDAEVVGVRSLIFFFNFVLEI